MRKLFSFLTMLCLLNLLALGGLLGYLVATQRVDRDKAVAIADLLRHKGTPQNLREHLVEILAPPPPAATGPATAPGARTAGGGTGAGGPGGPATAEERIDFARQAMEQERLRLEMEAQDLRHRQELLERLQAKIEGDRKKVEEDRKAFEQAVALAASGTGEETFQKTLALYDELKPKQLKDLFIPMGDELAARYLGAMAADRAAKIIAEFKTAEERAFILTVLERLRENGTAHASEGAAASRTMPAAPAPGLPAAAPAAAPAARTF